MYKSKIHSTSIGETFEPKPAVSRYLLLPHDRSQHFCIHYYYKLCIQT